MIGQVISYKSKVKSFSTNLKSINSKILSGFASKILSIKGKGILRENRIRLSLKVKYG